MINTAVAKKVDALEDKMATSVGGETSSAKVIMWGANPHLP